MYKTMGNSSSKYTERTRNEKAVCLKKPYGHYQLLLTSQSESSKPTDAISQLALEYYSYTVRQ